MTLRVGIVGCGLIAGGPIREGRPIMGTHAEACRELDGVSLVAAADTDVDRLTAFGRYWSIDGLYGTAAAMFAAEQLDISIVATPPETHLRECLTAVECGVRGLLCEKPFTGSTEGARRIVDACRRAGCKLVVNFSRRWDESHRALLRRIQTGELGTIREVAGLYTGTIRGNGAHFVDTLLMLAPGDWRVEWTSALGAEVDGPVEAVLTAGKEACAFLAPVRGAEYFVFEIQLVGTKGRARLLLQGNDLRLDFPRPHSGFPGYLYLQEAESFPSMTMPAASAHALRALASAVLSETEPEITADVHIVSLALIDAIVLSATRAEKSR